MSTWYCCRTVPAESDFFHANAERVAVPLTGPGGKIAVFETRKTGRIADGVSYTLFCKLSPDNVKIGYCDTYAIALWLPDGYSQIFRSYVFGPLGLLDDGSATLRYKI